MDNSNNTDGAWFIGSILMMAGFTTFTVVPTIIGTCLLYQGDIVQGVGSLLIALIVAIASLFVKIE